MRMTWFRKFAMILPVLAVSAFQDAWAWNTAGALSPSDLDCIGKQIFRNECAEDPAKLVYWDSQESFPSLGIGHFIWLPADSPEPFQDSFPDWLRFAEGRGVKIPDWLWNNGSPMLPWGSREAFLSDRQSSKTQQLRQLLEETRDTQVLFLMERLQRFYENAPEVRERLEKMSRTPRGLFALVDYLNFKGSGLKESERYQGFGWGLKQVLQEVDSDRFEQNPLDEFSKSALRVLERRIQHSDPARNEASRRAGWKNRVLSYLDLSCL